MHLDLAELTPQDRYKVLTSLVVPRPIAWVSTISKEGMTNIAPFSFFSIMGSKPPILTFAPGNKTPDTPKDTAQNIMDTKEFVVNLVDSHTAPQMVESAKPHTVSEIDLCELTPVASLAIKPPRIKESPVSMECKLHDILHIGQNRMVIGEILHLHVRDQLIDPESYHLTGNDYTPIGRMASPNFYCNTQDQFQLG